MGPKWSDAYRRQTRAVRVLIVVGAVLIAPLAFALVNAFVWLVTGWRIMPAGWWSGDRVGAMFLFAFIGVVALGIAIAISEDDEE